MPRRFKYYIPLFLQKVGYVVFFLLHRIFVDIEVRGRENILNLKGPVILASNHTSELDVTILPLVLSFFSPLYPIYCVTNATEKYNNFGWRSLIYGSKFFNMLGGYSTHSGFHDYGISLEDHIDLLEIGRTVFIFPEGKRTADGRLNPPRGGLGFMVYTTGATVVPIAIDTFFNVSPQEFFSFKRKVIITVLPPIHQDELITALNPSVEDYRHAGKIVLSKIEDILKK